MSAQKPRHPDTFSGAVTRVMGALTAEAAAEAVGKSASLVYKWADPDADQLPSIEQALRLDVAYVAAGYGSAPLLAVYSDRVVAAVTPIFTREDPLLRFAAATKEVGEVGDDLRRLRPGGYSHNDRAIIKTQAQQAIDALRDLIREVDAISGTER